MERCPNCRARLDEAETCRRCGMELGLLLATERAAEVWLRRGIGHLLRDDLGLAWHALRRALALQRDPLTEALFSLLNEQLYRAHSVLPSAESPKAEIGCDAELHGG
ncbi:MAG: hypothetical protein ACLFS2_01715 [Halochromatium sp.]|uniref:hypothetical protein n=1 Tax=Halochromatium sp. TaxID=2049430 RepID=UPI00397AFD90